MNSPDSHTTENTIRQYSMKSNKEFAWHEHVVIGNMSWTNITVTLGLLETIDQGHRETVLAQVS